MSEDWGMTLEEFCRAMEEIKEYRRANPGAEEGPTFIIDSVSANAEPEEGHPGNDSANR